MAAHVIGDQPRIEAGACDPPGFAAGQPGPRRRLARGASAALLSALVAGLLAACSGGATPGPASPAPAAATPAAASPSSGGTSTGATPAGGGPAGGAVQPGGNLCELLGAGDFSAAGVPGAGSPTRNVTTNDVEQAEYCVYAGVSAAGGGIELDAFVLKTPAAASGNFGDVGMYVLDPSEVTALGADKAGFYADQIGNDPKTTFDEMRVLKGRLWFDIGIPSSPQSKDRLLALAKLVLARATALI